VAVGERSTVTTRTIPSLWRRAVSAGRTEPAYLVKRDGAWAGVSWEEAGGRVDELAHGFLALGLKKGDAFAIFANTCLEWALVDFALAQIGVVVIPVYATSSSTPSRSASSARRTRCASGSRASGSSTC
jgi:long-subunit acyl-CoA synthetase (AMP-forming)